MNNQKLLLKTLSYKNISLILEKDLFAEYDLNNNFIVIPYKEVKKKTETFKRKPFKKLYIGCPLINTTITKTYTNFKTIKKALKKGYSMLIKNNEFILKGYTGIENTTEFKFKIGV